MDAQAGLEEGFLILRWSWRSGLLPAAMVCEAKIASKAANLMRNLTFPPLNSMQAA